MSWEREAAEQAMENALDREFDQAYRVRPAMQGEPGAMRLAIVGSTSFAYLSSWGYAAACIRHAVSEHRPAVIISGGAPGIDTLARNIAVEQGIELIEHLPEHPRWAPNGYKARNILIAEDCTHLLAIRCHKSRTYGSGWTADYAENIRRTVRRIIL